MRKCSSWHHLIRRGRTEPFKVLGIETSCDDTAVSIVTSDKKICSQIVRHQHALHAITQGIVPSVAAEEHRKCMADVIKHALKEAGCSIMEIDVFAATRGPGIAASLSVGFTAGRVLAAATDKPFCSINHMEGHLLVPRIKHHIPFPFLSLVITGGHTLLILATSLGDYHQLGTTLDSSVGEVIDKASRYLGFPYDHLSGPADRLSKAAEIGDYRYSRELPQVKAQRICNSLDFSFSGLKTAFRNLVEREKAEIARSEELRNTMARCFLDSCAAHLADRLQKATAYAKANCIMEGPIPITITGGVARNRYLVQRILALMKDIECEIHVCPEDYCTDNATMIAWAAIERILVGFDESNYKDIKQDWTLADLKLEN